MRIQLRFDRRQNRFQKASGTTAEAPSRTSSPAFESALFLEVSGLVTYRDDAPIEVRIFGATFEFDRAGPFVRVGNARYALVSRDGRELLVGTVLR